MELVGFKTKILYESYKNDFAIIRIIDENTNNEYVLKGNIRNISDNKTYLFNVEKEKNIFLVKKYIEVFPKTKKGIIKLFDHYFLSPIITKKIIDNNFNTVENIIISKDKIKNILNKNESKLFLESIELIESYFEQLKKIFNHFLKHNLLDEKFSYIYNFLISFINKNNVNAYYLLTKNPYKFFIESDFNFSFELIDIVAKTFMNNSLSPIRIIYWIRYINNMLTTISGNTFSFLDEIIGILNDKIFKHTKINILEKKELISISILHGEKLNLIKLIENNKVIDYDIFLAEKNIAQKLMDINNTKINYPTNYKKIIKNKLINNIIEFTDEQKNIILNTFDSNIILISGGPGTGKSTIVNGIIISFIEIYKNKFNIILLAPTGKATNRLKLSIDFEIKTISTIHSFISKCINNKIKGNKEIILIIDEMTMVDTALFSDLLSEIYIKTKINKIILLGDDNQLKSIKCGNIFNDLLETKKFKSYYLTKNFRQKNNVDFILFTKNILKKDFKYTENNYQKIKLFCLNNKENIIKICTKELEKNNILNTQIITASKKYKLGSDNINRFIQKSLNPFNKINSIKITNDKYFKINDKVIQTTNNSNLKIYNGDFGIIEDIFYKNNDNKIKNIVIRVNFDNYIVEIPYKYIKDIELGYATTVHKMQGSENEYIIFIIDSFAKFFLQKNLIYTAITRAKNKLLILTDNLDEFNKGINNIPPKRHTFLKEYIN